MSMPEQSGDSFDFCVLFRVYFTGKGAFYLFRLNSGCFNQIIILLICKLQFLVCNL